MKMLCAVLSLTALVISSVAFAADDPSNWEVSGDANVGFSHSSVNQGQSSTQFSIGATTDYFVMPMLEAGLKASFVDTNKGGTSKSSTSLLFGPTYNFLGAAAEAFFVSGRAGIAITDEGYGFSAFSAFAWEFAVGKRIELAHHVSWSPEFSFGGVASSTDASTGYQQSNSTTWTFTPFRFSILF